MNIIILILYSETSMLYTNCTLVYIKMFIIAQNFLHIPYVRNTTEEESKLEPNSLAAAILNSYSVPG